ncbi:ftsX-like permease family protein [[Clostridium] bifermentans ATCC 19299]|uniref:ABC transporter permease n=1 Tax=Paraclostridium bifermentans TaxID=1490 RepID=A0A5P3XGG8_PARBF|nr:ABC transporter permease [Paraclostridium bifermentans]EQK48672.1 ftsX-like permease family protein [[Clostridium] bifermentans ATCC 19299] [Paraclostridium bifermentans ATCC 19299]MDV8113635.1 ABC transporter permease [Bacillus sp. BAU-SS-2023]QEZ69464.1 ABC transporter permease [Paraclostridium bifermentans]QEZ69590.1 ABC transporter permease [Paraclostridium bifermentans]
MRLIDIAKRYIMQNKKNSLLIIVSIIISTALFLFMNIISEDVRSIMINQSKKDLGQFHASYYNPTDEDIKNITNNRSIEIVGKSMLLGFHDIGNAQTLQIISDDKNTRSLKSNYTLQEGIFPTKENEIAIDSWYIEQKKIENPIGKNIKLDYARYNSTGDKVLYKGEKEFKIVGILRCHPVLKSQGTSLGLITEESAKKNIPIKNKYDQVTFKFNKEKNIENQINKLVKDCNLKKSDINLNTKLILAMSDSLRLKIPYMIVNMILALATILLIYNTFYILVSNRIKEFGVLRAVGLIPKDIFKLMTLEVFIYIIISIPIGLVSGGVVTNLSRDYVIGAIYNINYVNSIKSDTYINTYIFTILLSFSTIIISVIKPLIKASKTDPMICIRRNGEKINIREKSLINKFMIKYFKDYGNIASKNLQRNRKRTNLAIASMSIMIFLMITVYTKSTSNFFNDGALRSWIPGDYLIHNIDMASIMDNKKSYDINTMKDIEKIDGVKKVSASRDKNFHMKINDENIDKKSSYWNTNKKSLEMNSETNNGIKVFKTSFEVIGIEDTSILKNVLIDGEENLKKLNDIPYIYIDNNSSKSLNIKKGDKVNVTFDIVDSKTNNYEKTLSKDFVVGGLIKNLPITSQGGGRASEAVISVKQFNEFVGNSSYERFDIWTSKLANQKYVEDELNNIVGKSGKGVMIPYKSESSAFEKSDNQKAMIVALVAGLIVVLSLFNCCNTIVTSISSRSREFALFRGIGISKDEVKKIVVLESYIYIIVGFIISIIPTLIVRYIIIKPFENIHLINLKFIIATIIILIAVSIIIIITTLKTLKNIQGDDFIEQIKTLE